MAFFRTGLANPYNLAIAVGDRELFAADNGGNHLELWS